MIDYTDTNPGFSAGPTLEREPVIMPAETYTYQAAAERVYERGSIAEMLQTMFREADEAEAQGFGYETTEYWVREYPSDTEAFREFMRSVQAELKQSSIVQQLRLAVKNGDPISVQNIKDVFTAYERAVSAAVQKLRETLSPTQLSKLRHSAQSDLDWTYRDMLIDRVAAGESADVRASVHDFFLILNPKARKIQYMTKEEVITTLHHSMARTSTDQLKRDLNVIHQHEELPVVQAFLRDDEYADIESRVPYQDDLAA